MPKILLGVPAPRNGSMEPAATGSCLTYLSFCFPLIYDMKVFCTPSNEPRSNENAS